MPYCEECGNLLSERAKFCPKCGICVGTASTVIDSTDTKQKMDIKAPSAAITPIRSEASDKMAQQLGWLWAKTEPMICIMAVWKVLEPFLKHCSDICDWEYIHYLQCEEINSAQTLDEEKAAYINYFETLSNITSYPLDKVSKDTRKNIREISQAFSSFNESVKNFDNSNNPFIKKYLLSQEKVTATEARHLLELENRIRRLMDIVNEIMLIQRPANEMVQYFHKKHNESTLELVKGLINYGGALAWAKFNPALGVPALLGKIVADFQNTNSPEKKQEKFGETLSLLFEKWGEAAWIMYETRDDLYDYLFSWSHETLMPARARFIGELIDHGDNIESEIEDARKIWEEVTGYLNNLDIQFRMVPDKWDKKISMIKI